MLEIDGATLSGSGMIVRQAAAYAAITATSIRIRNVRARRPQPGLRAQHLRALDAVRTLTGGEIEGGYVGSGEFAFRPGRSRPHGEYRFDIGTAGSATALTLALLPVLTTSVEPVQIEITGGLFQDHAPSFFHLQQVLVPLLGRMGFNVATEMVRPGYVPTGGGLMRVRSQPDARLAPLVAERQAEVRRVWGTALASHLEQRQVAARMAEVARRVLAAAGWEASIEERNDSTATQAGAGLAVFAELADGMRLGADRAGAHGRSAERVAAAAAHVLLEDLRSGACLDRFASDQMIVFAALAAGRTSVRIAAVTEHVRTAMWLAQLFEVATAQLDGRLLVIQGARSGDIPYPHRTAARPPTSPTQASASWRDT